MATSYQVLESIVLNVLNEMVRFYPILQCYGCEIDHPSQTQHPHLMDNVCIADTTWVNMVEKQFRREMTHRSFVKAVTLMGLKESGVYYFSRMLDYQLDVWKDVMWCPKNGLDDDLWKSKVQTIRSATPNAILFATDTIHELILKENTWTYHLQVSYFQHMLKALEIPNVPFDQRKQFVNKEQIVQEVGKKIGSPTECWSFEPYSFLIEFENTLQEHPKFSERVEMYLVREASINFELQDAEIKLGMHHDNLQQAEITLNSSGKTHK